MNKRASWHKQRVNMKSVLLYVKYFMEHMEDLLINLNNPVNRAAYREIKDGTRKIAQTPG